MDPGPLGRRAEPGLGKVCEGVRANLIAGGKPSDAAIIDEAAAIGVAVVRSHRRDIDALRQAAAGLLGELGAPTQRDEDGVLVVVPLIHRSPGPQDGRASRMSLNQSLLIQAEPVP